MQAVATDGEIDDEEEGELRKAIAAVAAAPDISPTKAAPVAE